MKKFETLTRNRYLLVYDILIAVLAYAFTALFFYPLSGLSAPDYGVHPLDAAYFVCCLCVYLCFICVLKNHCVIWPHAGSKNYSRLFFSVSGTLIVNFLISYLFPIEPHFAFLFNFLIIIWSAGSRMAVRGIYQMIKIKNHKFSSSRTIQVLIIGAGTSGSMLLRALTTSASPNVYYNVVGFIDKDPHKIGSYVEDTRVLGDASSIVSLCAKYEIDEIYIALPSADLPARMQIFTICSQTGCKLKIIDRLENSLATGNKIITRNVDIEALLQRSPVHLDNSSIESDIKDQVVLVTGGGGSIGSELCRQIARFSPRKLLVLDVYENGAYDLQMELKRQYPQLHLDVIIGSIRDEGRIMHLFERYRPHIVFHAAAHKHVPLMEDSPAEAIKNNIFGTYNVVRCADKYHVSKFVFISTDKAVNPTNVMGATKRMCEMIIQAMDKASATKFMAVRFGNVLGSNGSVIPLFKRQIAHGGPVTVTHREITRFFMTIPEAAQLVIQAATSAGGGEIFILDMGAPVRIYDLAENLIRLSGYRPGIDIPIEITGLRPGEKLYEELLMDEEGLTNTQHEKIFIGRPSDITMTDIEEKLQILKKALPSDDTVTIQNALKAVVPTYLPPPNKSHTLSSCTNKKSMV